MPLCHLFTRGHHWEGIIQDVASVARAKLAAGLREVQAQQDGCLRRGLLGVEEEQVYQCPELFFYIMFDFDPFPIDVVFIFYSIWDNDALVHFDFLF